VSSIIPSEMSVICFFCVLWRGIDSIVCRRNIYEKGGNKLLYSKTKGGERGKAERKFYEINN